MNNTRPSIIIEAYSDSIDLNNIEDNDLSKIKEMDDYDIVRRKTFDINYNTHYFNHINIIINLPYEDFEVNVTNLHRGLYDIFEDIDANFFINKSSRLSCFPDIGLVYTVTPKKEFISEYLILKYKKIEIKAKDSAATSQYILFQVYYNEFKKCSPLRFKKALNYIYNKILSYFVGNPDISLNVTKSDIVVSYYFYRSDTGWEVTYTMDELMKEGQKLAYLYAAVTDSPSEESKMKEDFKIDYKYSIFIK